MRVLALDTTTPPGSLALWEDGRVLCERPVQDERPFGACLPGSAVAALADFGWTLAQVDLFVVGRGPGSLTGLRVGIATAQGFAFAAGRPLAGVSALEAIAETVRPNGVTDTSLVAAWMDARRSEVFAQLFERAPDGSLQTIDGPLVGTPGDIAEKWIGIAGERFLDVVGTAAEATADVWAPPDERVRVRVHDARPLAAAMAQLGAQASAAGLAGPPHALVPLYVRRPDAEIARDRKRRQAELPGGSVA